MAVYHVSILQPIQSSFYINQLINIHKILLFRNVFWTYFRTNIHFKMYLYSGIYSEFGNVMWKSEKCNPISPLNREVPVKSVHIGIHKEWIPQISPLTCVATYLFSCLPLRSVIWHADSCYKLFPCTFHSSLLISCETCQKTCECHKPKRDLKSRKQVDPNHSSRKAVLFQQLQKCWNVSSLGFNC